MKKITFRTITTLKDCKNLWSILSPKKTLYDEWDFRYAYYRHFNYSLVFITAFDKEEPVGLLPLMFDREKGYLDFFAGFEYMEDNGLFLKKGYEDCSEEFLDQVQGERPALLEYIGESLNLNGSVIHDYNYFINLKGLSDYEDFLHHYLHGESRRNIEYQIRKINKNEVEISYGNRDDILILEKWNKIRFGKHSSFYERPHWEEFYKEIAEKFNSQIITVSINGQKEGVGFLILYKNICYGINAGYNPEIKNLGKYITLLKIDYAIKKGAQIYDAGSGAFGWKEDFNLLKRPLYRIDTRHYFVGKDLKGKNKIHTGRQRLYL